MRAILIILGVLSVGVGVIGVFVPGLPTTVFLLIASGLFARSSPRLHRWLQEHPRLGPYLVMVQTRSMPLRARIFSVAAIWTGIGVFVVSRPESPMWAFIGMAAAGVVGTVCVCAMRAGRTGMRVKPATAILR